MNIILVHGILGSRNLFQVGSVGLVPYFRNVANWFQKLGDHVLTVELDRTAGVSFRASQLREQIESGLGEGGGLNPKKPTHIIAHSMGGLDSRLLLSPKNPTPNDLPIRSLTTIGTPHYGSQIADAVDNPAVPPAVRQAIQHVLGRFGLSLDGLRDLRTDRCHTFSETYTNRDGVDYSYITGIGRPGIIKAATLLAPLHTFVRLQTGEANDGLVTRSSSAWGNPVGEWPADHADEIGHSLPIALPEFDHKPRYLEIRTRLATLV